LVDKKSNEKTGKVRESTVMDRPPVTLLLDSSFVISLVKQRRDFERELADSLPQKIRIKILDLVTLELERLARKSSSSTRTWARASLELLASRGYQILDHKPGPVDVDASLIVAALSERTPTAVATIDRELRVSLKSLGIPVLLPRKGHGVVVDGLN
jgi:rRNA-processing protein FCF1